VAETLLYTTATGQPWQHFTASSEALLTAQVAPSGFAFAAVPSGLTAVTLPQYVYSGDAFAPLTPVTITATPNPFAADGVTECTVTLDPFVAGTLLVGTTPYVLTSGDPTLVLTSDVPTTFAVRLAWNPTQYADPILIMAEAP
jgi:hypothetical protein